MFRPDFPVKKYMLHHQILSLNSNKNAVHGRHEEDDYIMYVDKMKCCVWKYGWVLHLEDQYEPR